MPRMSDNDRKARLKALGKLRMAGWNPFKPSPEMKVQPGPDQPQPEPTPVPGESEEDKKLREQHEREKKRNDKELRDLLGE